MQYNDLYNQYLNFYNNPTTAQAPNVPIAQEAPSQSQGQIAQGAGLAGKGAGIYAGGKLGGALFGGSKLAAPQLVGAKVVGSGSGLAAPKLVGAKVVGGGQGVTGLGSALGTVAPLAAVGHGLYTGGKFLAGDKLNTGEKLAYALPTAGLSLFSDELQGLFGSGKSKYQQAREATRGKLAELGLLEDLGSKVYSANFEGQDPFKLGRSGDYYSDSYDRSIKDLSRVLARDAEKMANNKRMGWDIDYTSDLDMLTSTVSKDLGRLLTGAELDKNLMHGFNELTNASLADTDREFNKENWANTMGDMRSLYERAGFEDANAAYGRLNELVGSGAIDDKAKEEIMQSIGMAYGDNSFDLANQINQGRWTGVDMEGAGIANDINLPLDPLANVDTTNLVLKPGTLSQEQAEMLAGALA